MSGLSKLISDLCPDGVEYKPLGEVATLVKGTGLQKKDFTDSGVGCIHYGQIHTRFDTYTDHVLSHVSRDLAERLLVIHPGDVVVAVTSEDVSACCKAVAWLGDEDVVTGGHSVVLRHSIDPMYLAYCFQTQDFYNQKKRYAAGVKVVEMRTDRLARIRIPVPPISIQREVVRLLGNYSAKNAELRMQIRSEAKLLEHQVIVLCNTLISRSCYRRECIGLLGNLFRGKRFTAADYVECGIPSIHYGEVYTAYGISAKETVSSVREDMCDSLRYAEPNDVIIACTGENKEDICKPVAWLGDTKVAVHDDCHIFHHSMDARYVAYAMLTTEFRDQKVRAATESKVVRVSGKKLASMTIPVPPTERQREIADTLDRAFSLTDQLIAELTTEMELLELEAQELRTQLLTFPEKTS